MAVNTLPHQLNGVKPQCPARVIPLRSLKIHDLAKRSRDLAELSRADRLGPRLAIPLPSAMRTWAMDRRLAATQLRIAQPDVYTLGVGRHRSDAGVRRDGVIR